MSQAVQASTKVGADLYVEVQQFYARQMRLLDALDVDEYAKTFTADGFVHHAHRNERSDGREAMTTAMRAALPRYVGIAVRHWFDHLLVNPTADGALHVSYYSMVTRTDVAGNVTFEPTFTIEDVLVRRGGELFTHSRTVYRDMPVHL